MKKLNIIRSIFTAELLLLVPLMAMLFTDEVNWEIADFVIAGVLLAGVGLACQLIATGIKSNRRLAVIGIVLAAIILLVWVEMAVGLFGPPIAGS